MSLSVIRCASRQRDIFFALFAGIALIACLVPPAVAQAWSSLSGTVTDPSGALVAGASVTIRNLDTGMERIATTDDAGRYQVLLLPVGNYEVVIHKEGFALMTRTGIHLAVSQDAEIDIGLKLSREKQQVIVNADAAAVNLTTADISGLVGDQQVKDLPLNGRSFDELLTLNPGIVNFTAEKTGGVGVSNSTVGNNFAVSGNRPQQNLFLLNGVEFTGAAENNMQPGGTSQELLGVEGVREFNVLRDYLWRRVRQAPWRAGADCDAGRDQQLSWIGL